MESVCTVEKRYCSTKRGALLEVSIKTMKDTGEIFIAVLPVTTALDMSNNRWRSYTGPYEPDEIEENIIGLVNLVASGLRY